MFYRKKSNGRYEEVSPGQIVLEAVRLLNQSPGGREVTDLLTLKTLQGKLVLKGEVENGEEKD